MASIFSLLLMLVLAFTPILASCASESAPSASFTLNGQGVQYSLSAPNPNQPVTFSNSNGYLGVLNSPSSVTISTFPENPVQTSWNENPIELAVISITPDQGEPTGGCAILYGYYTEDAAQGLEFYYNAEQSQTATDLGFGCGYTELPVAIDNSIPAISLNE